MNQTIVKENEIRILISKIIEVDPDKIGLETNFIEELGADSMTALEIMATLEKKFNVTIPEEDLPKMSNLKQVIQLLSSLLENGKK